MLKSRGGWSVLVAALAVTAAGMNLPVFAVVATAAEVPAGSTAKDTLRISVKGMVCSFCAQGLKKKFGEEAGVTSVDVKLKDRTVTLTGGKGKLPAAERVATLVKEAGFNLDRIELNGVALELKEDPASSPEHHGSHDHSSGGGHEHDGHH